ncbi:hypothetical protein [Frigoribacterium sp. Leaf44]|uniref:hypothetical protein n=1 Tax=Frigoribacterium sp. Leaf44 TaxID=1736220 RepID=UPI0006FDBE8A|nr:hypothetical protein [Frigoribacterium sp. Leaf44]KQN41381.1 hypothetical protein ASE87_10940 [Frigoribacterium sp. Leaf44]
MSRPWDWSPLDLASDPVPGDPTDIRSSATSARATGTSIETQSRRLRRLAKAEGWDSESGRTFTTSAEPLADAIDKAKQRYLDLATALDTYADGLEELQRQADAARLDADEAKEARRTADTFVVPGETDPFEIDRQEAARTRAVDLADTDLADAKAVITRLVGTGGDTDGEYGALNDQAIAAIRLAGDDELRDTWWDGVKQAVHDARGVLGAIKDVLNALGPVLAVLSFVPIIGPFALGLGIAAAVLLLVITLAQASAGDATTADVGAELLGVGLSIVGLGAAKGALVATSGMRRSIIDSVSARALAGVPAKAAKQARIVERQAVAERLDAVARNPLVTSLDNLLLGGAAEMFAMRRLAAGGPKARELFAPGVVSALTNGLLGAGQNVKSLVSAGQDAADIAAGTYWTEKTKIHVGSL